MSQVVLPLLGGLLLYQYTVLIGLPPGVAWSSLLHGSGNGQDAALLADHLERRHPRPPAPPDTPSTAAVLKVGQFRYGPRPLGHPAAPLPAKSTKSTGLSFSGCGVTPFRVFARQYPLFHLNASQSPDVQYSHVHAGMAGHRDGRPRCAVGAVLRVGHLRHPGAGLGVPLQTLRCCSAETMLAAPRTFRVSRWQTWNMCLAITSVLLQSFNRYVLSPYFHLQVHWAASHPPVNRGRAVTDDALPGA